MPARVYRVCRAIQARLDGEGARRAGGRWNSPGRPAVYMAQNVSLAVLENLVHMSKSDFPVGYVSVCAVIPDDILILTPAEILENASSRQIGDHWIDTLSSAVLRVPSAVVSAEFNYVLNPRHPEFARIAIEQIKPFVFDPRLF
jgi:RES domain-containing protein